MLGLLDRDGPRTTSELATAQVVRHQSMARTVAQLVALGLVGQEADPSDGRKTQLSITEAGRARLEAERARRVDWLSDAITHELTADELETLQRGTELLARLARDRGG